MSSKKSVKENIDEFDWKIIESYFHNQYLNRLVRHQIESYNYFISSQIQETIKMFNPVNVKSENDKNENGIYSLEIIINFETSIDVCTAPSAQP